MPYGHTFSQLGVSQAYGPYSFVHDSQIQEAGYFVSRNVFHNFHILANNSIVFSWTLSLSCIKVVSMPKELAARYHCVSQV